MRTVMRLAAFSLVAFVFGAGAASAARQPSDTAKDQLNFGVAMAQRQLWNEALFRFRRAALLDPSNPHVFNNLAVACEATGRFEEALESYQKALRLAPADRTLKANYTRFVEFYQSFKPPAVPAPAVAEPPPESTQAPPPAPPTGS